jgi:amidase
MLLDHDPARAFLPYPPVAVASAPDGPLKGLRLGVKDLFDVVGYPTSCGNPSILAASGIKQTTAPNIQKLLDAGASFVGKTQTDEIAYSLFGANPHFGTPLNTKAPDRIPGGSSSGSAAAVAAGLVDIAVGTDTGGSVRAPASFCGLWGIRPTQDRISLEGCMTLAPSFDTLGFFARDGATMLRVGDVLLGDDPTPLPESPRMLWAVDMFDRLGTAEAALLETVTADIATEPAEVFADMPANQVFDAFRILQSREIVRQFDPWIEAKRPHMGGPVAERLTLARTLNADQEAAAGRAQGRFRAAIDACLGADGVLIAPVVASAPVPLVASPEVNESFRLGAMTLLSVAGLAGLPQVVLPAGTIGGGPLGISLIGSRGSDRSLLAFAHRLWPNAVG